MLRIKYSISKKKLKWRKQRSSTFLRIKSKCQELSLSIILKKSWNVENKVEITRIKFKFHFENKGKMLRIKFESLFENKVEIIRIQFAFHLENFENKIEVSRIKSELQEQSLNNI